MRRSKIILTLMCCLVAVMAKADVYSIWPVPQCQEAAIGVATLPANAVIINGKGIDNYTVARAKQILVEHDITATVGKKAQKGSAIVYLGIYGSGDNADRIAKQRGLKQDIFSLTKYDRHIVSVRQGKDGADIVILGENTDAVFCGLASLEQMLDAHKQELSCVDIYDYADIKYRGIIEGYYGVPYNAEVTQDLFRFMARYKMNTYMYGAKSDVYHSQYWDKPYPTTLTQQQQRVGMLTQDQMRSLTAAGHQNKVNFIWAIHPGGAFTDAAQDNVLDRIMDKFAKMHELGVRQFGVFVDDVGVPDDDASLKLGADRLTKLQGLVDAKWNGKKVAPEDTVKPLHYVPQLYAYSWVTREKAERFFRSLSSTPAKTCIYITGRAVWTVPNSEDPGLVSSWLGRDVAWWWNYPCNDNDMNKIFPLDMYRNFDDEAHIDRNATLEPDLKGVQTLISNPMQQGEVSKISLFSIADYAWNMKAFDNDASWMASLNAVFGKLAPNAFRLLPYLRYYDTNSPLADLIRAYKVSPDDARMKNALLGELNNIVSNAKAMSVLASSSNPSDKLLWTELRPFVEKVADMSSLAADFLNGHGSKAAVKAIDSNEKYKFDVLNGMGNDIKLSRQVADPSAKMLRPFLDWLAK